MISTKFISLATIISLYSCTNASAPNTLQTVACKSDNDCKGDRICNKGVCEDKGSSGTQDIGSVYDIGKRVYDTSGEYIPQNDSYTPPPVDISQRVQDSFQPSDVSRSTCTPHASKVCYNDDVYWKDSCDKIEDLVENCSTNQYCANATCMTKEPSCTPHAVKVCYSGDVYWKDSCGKLEDKIQTCTTKDKCENATCIPKCTPHVSKVCKSGGTEYPSVYWQNSCGILEEKIQECTPCESCVDAKCVKDAITEFKYCVWNSGTTEKLYLKKICTGEEIFIKDCATEGKKCNTSCVDKYTGEKSGSGGCWSEGDDESCGVNQKCAVSCGL